jgi:multidrug transporter EmrE-like cation transporter
MRAVMSGLLGASASCVAKLALAPDSMLPQRANDMCQGWILMSDHSYCWVVSEVVVRGLCLVTMVVLNAIMMSSFLDGLQDSGTVVATSLSSAANFLMSALYGMWIFDESIHATGVLGLFLLALGVGLLSTVSILPTNNNNDDDDRHSPVPNHPHDHLHTD